MKRSLSLFLAVLMAAVLCLSFASADELAMSDVPGMTAPGVLPIVTEETQLTISIAAGVKCTDFDDNDLTRLVEEETGIDIVWDLLPAAETATVLDLRFSSGEELSDIINYNFGSTGCVTYGAQGVFLPLNDLIDKYAYFIYESALTDEQVDEYMRRLKEADGNIYSWCNYVNALGDQRRVDAYINQLWLDKLELDKPTNLDELYDVLCAFRDNDMNGNGDTTDEFPMFTQQSVYNGGFIQFIVNNFVYYDAENYLDVKDNVVFAPFVTDEWQQAMIYINKLVADGLLSPTSLTITADEYKAMLQNYSPEEQICGVITGCPTVIANDVNNPFLLAYDVLPAFEGQYTPERASVMQKQFVITTDCDTPEVAFRFFDYFAQPRVSIQLRKGIIGQNIEWRDDDPDAFDAKYPNAAMDAYNAGIDARYYVIPGVDDPWANVNNTIWHVQFCGINPTQLYASSASVTPASEFPAGWAESFANGDLVNHRNYLNAVEYDAWTGSLPEQVFYDPTYTLEEGDLANDAISNVKTYLNESIGAFATGTMDPVADWDTYLAKMDEAGLQTWLQVAQAYWDRSNG